MDVSEGLVY